MEWGVVLWGMVLIFGLVYFLSPLVIMSGVSKLNRQTDEVNDKLGRIADVLVSVNNKLKLLMPPEQKPPAAEKKPEPDRAPAGAIQTLNLKS